MSFKLVDAVLHIRLTATEKAVLIALCSHTKDHGRNMFAGLDTLANESGASKRTVRRILRTFEKRNFIRDIAPDNEKAGGKGKTVRYEILIPNMDIWTAIQESYKADKMTAFDAANADTMTAFDESKADTTTPKADTTTPKADTMSAESVPESVLESVHPNHHVRRWTFENMAHGMPDVPCKHQAKLTAWLDEFGGDVVDESVRDWQRQRALPWDGVLDPWNFFLQEGKKYCEENARERVRKEWIAAEDARREAECIAGLLPDALNQLAYSEERLANAVSFNNDFPSDDAAQDVQEQQAAVNEWKSKVQEYSQ